MAFVVGDGTLTRFGMIGGLEIIHSLSSILSYTSVLIIRKLVFGNFFGSSNKWDFWNLRFYRNFHD